MYNYSADELQECAKELRKNVSQQKKEVPKKNM